MKKTMSWSAYTRIIILSFFSMNCYFSFAQLDYSKTYVNVSKSINGGTAETGDTLEIRATFAVKTGTYDSCAFYDIISIGTSYISNTLKILTNEGKTYKSFTDNFGDDCGYTSGNSIRINLGFNPASRPATAFRRGRIQNTDRPTVGGNTCLMIASYRLKITTASGSTINLGGGSISYKLSSAALTSITFASNSVAVNQNLGICSNSIGTNAISAEFNGTFGSGKNRNRGASGSVPTGYTYQIFSSGSPGDYYYGIGNNTSIQTGYTTTNNWPKPDAAHRVFSLWDIIGDHTGAADLIAGNPAADTVDNPNAGYMLVINASYKTDTAFTYTVSGLCSNTYYELSAWIRNICSRCGSDSIGRGSTTAGYIPTAPGDSSGVYPNLTFGINGLDCYSTGYINYTGRWIKKGFTYLTGPSQTSFTLTIRNNAPGGGGNDWAIDDIAIATCTPNLTLVPSGNANVCEGNQVDISCKVRCFSPNYINWLWEKSTDGGVTWAFTGVSGTGNPTLVDGEYEYTAAYPSFLGTTSDHLNKYRIRIGSTVSNLNSADCSFTGVITIVILVNNCGVTLLTDLISFNGYVKKNQSTLEWTTINEKATTTFELERSNNNINFLRIASFNSSTSQERKGIYVFIDLMPVKEPYYYRIKIISEGSYKYSRTILLGNADFSFEIRSLLNPFNDVLSFELLSPSDGKATVALIDIYGKMVKQFHQNIYRGLNTVTIHNLQSVQSGTYALYLTMDERLTTQKVLKLTR